jgi:hypothetical protein
MLTEPLPHEGFIMRGPASMGSRDEKSGGMLYLTNRRLIFESHRPDGQDLCIVIALEDIGTVTAGWSKWLNLIPLAPNAMSLETTRGKTYHLLLFGRHQWVTSIENAKNRLVAPPHDSQAEDIGDNGDQV